VYSEKLLMMDRGTSKYAEFYYKNKYEKLVHLVGFIIRFFHDDGHLNVKNHKTDSIVKVINKYEAGEKR